MWHPGLDEPAGFFFIFYFSLGEAGGYWCAIKIFTLNPSLGRNVVQVWLSVTQDVHKGHGEDAFSFRFSLDVSDLEGENQKRKACKGESESSVCEEANRSCRESLYRNSPTTPGPPPPLL